MLSTKSFLCYLFLLAGCNRLAQDSMLPRGNFSLSDRSEAFPAGPLDTRPFTRSIGTDLISALNGPNGTCPNCKRSIPYTIYQQIHLDAPSRVVQDMADMVLLSVDYLTDVLAYLFGPRSTSNGLDSARIFDRQFSDRTHNTFNHINDLLSSLSESAGITLTPEHTAYCFGRDAPFPLPKTLAEVSLNSMRALHIAYFVTRCANNYLPYPHGLGTGSLPIAPVPTAAHKITLMAPIGALAAQLIAAFTAETLARFYATCGAVGAVDAATDEVIKAAQAAKAADTAANLAAQLGAKLAPAIALVADAAAARAQAAVAGGQARAAIVIAGTAGAQAAAARAQAAVLHHGTIADVTTTLPVLRFRNVSHAQFVYANHDAVHASATAANASATAVNAKAIATIATDTATSVLTTAMSHSGCDTTDLDFHLAEVALNVHYARISPSSTT